MPLFSCETITIIRGIVLTITRVARTLIVLTPRYGYYQYHSYSTLIIIVIFGGPFGDTAITWPSGDASGS